MEFGICKLAVVPLRKEGNDQSEMVSQVLFGEYFKILKIETKWIFIQLAKDDYKGWICSKQYQEITYEDYENLSINEFPKVLNSNATVESLVNKEIIPISQIPERKKNKDEIVCSNGVVYDKKDSILKQILSDLYGQRKDYKKTSYEYYTKAKEVKDRLAKL